MTDCVFCKIITGEIPSFKVYEDDKTLAFLDIHPTSKGHTLVLPKEHTTNIEDISEADLCSLIKVVKKVGQMIKAGLEVEGYNIIVNNNSVAGQLIPHLHFHLIPRREDDGLRPWRSHFDYQEGEAEEIISKLKAKI